MNTNSANILGYQIAQVTRSGFMQCVTEFLKDGKNHTIVFLNPHIALLGRKCEELNRYIHEADMVVADGIGLIWASRVLKCPLPERITGTDFMIDISELCANQGYKICLLGARPGVASRCAERLSSKFHKLKIVGTYHGYFDEKEEEFIIGDIRENEPDILAVCLGVPKQEMWIRRNRSQLCVPLVFGNGGALDFVAGNVKRAPKWVQDVGLEWLVRLAQEPGRLWKRYLLGNLRFAYLVLDQIITKKCL
jgi:N-acetylglucosaminyldiphosphoundecaprenol N-acetyl-beta-D-mannosaminyltransferase